MHCLILVPREEAEKEEVSADESVPVGDQTTLQPKVTYLPNLNLNRASLYESCHQVLTHNNVCL